MYVEMEVRVGDYLPNHDTNVAIKVTQDRDSIPFCMTVGETEFWLSDEVLRRMKNVINTARRARRGIV